MRYPNPTPAPPGLARDQARHAWRRPQRQGHARTSFPNPEAKTASADGTAPARVWESRTPPPAHHKGGPATGPPFSRPHHRTHRPHRPHSHTHRPHGQATQPHTQTQTIRTQATVNPTINGAFYLHPTHQKPHRRQSSPHPVRSLSTGSGPALRARDRAEHNQTRAHRLMR